MIAKSGIAREPGIRTAPASADHHRPAEPRRGAGQIGPHRQHSRCGIGQDQPVAKADTAKEAEKQPGMGQSGQIDQDQYRDARQIDPCSGQRHAVNPDPGHLDPGRIAPRQKVAHRIAHGRGTEIKAKHGRRQVEQIGAQQRRAAKIGKKAPDAKADAPQ